MQPGQLISPGNDGPSQQNDQPSPQADQASTAPAAAPPVPATTTVESFSDNSRGNPVTSVAPVNDDTLSWTASEFIERQKPQGWYLSLVLGAILVSAVLYFILRDLVTTVVIAVAAVLFGFVGARKPNATTFALSRKGIQIGAKSYPYTIFKSFSILEEGAINSIQLLPLKRFMPPISIYFPPDMEDQIVELLADYLPHEERDHDAIDRLMKRMHF